MSISIKRERAFLPFAVLSFALAVIGGVPACAPVISPSHQTKAPKDESAPATLAANHSQLSVKPVQTNRPVAVAPPPLALEPKMEQPKPEQPKAEPPKVERASPPPERKIDVAAERQALLQRDFAFADMAEKKGAAEAFYEFMAPDATLLQTGELPIKGTETIKVRLAAGQRGTLIWKPEDADVAGSGDMGFTWGNYSLRSSGAETRLTYGKYVHIWKKQEGQWKVVLSTSNASPAPAQRRLEPGTQ